jgi:hypothetical protein
MTALAERQAEFCSYFIPGFPMRSAAAIGGNATQESLVTPVTIGAKDHGSDGVLQWRLERLDALKAYCAAQGLGWDTLKGQAMFTWHELNNPAYAGLYGDLTAGTKSLETLTLNFCDAFERPSEAGREADKRIRYAHDCLAILMRDVPAPVPPIVVAPLPTTPVTLQQVESLQMPIEIILQLVAPLAESLISGLLKGVLTHVQANGVPISPANPLSVHPTAPAAVTLPTFDFAQLAQLIVAEMAKLQAGKPL